MGLISGSEKKQKMGDTHSRRWDVDPGNPGSPTNGPQGANVDFVRDGGGAPNSQSQHPDWH